MGERMTWISSSLSSFAVSDELTLGVFFLDGDSTSCRLGERRRFRGGGLMGRSRDDIFLDREQRESHRSNVWPWVILQDTFAVSWTNARVTNNRLQIRGPFDPFILCGGRRSTELRKSSL